MQLVAAVVQAEMQIRTVDEREVGRLQDDCSQAPGNGEYNSSIARLPVDREPVCLLAQSLPSTAAC